MEQKKKWFLHISLSPRKQLDVKQFSHAYDELQMLAIYGLGTLQSGDNNQNLQTVYIPTSISIG